MHWQTPRQVPVRSTKIGKCCQLNCPEFEGIKTAWRDDLAGVQRSLWAVELPPTDAAVTPQLPDAMLFGAERAYPICQQEARRLRALGHTRFDVIGAALLQGQAQGWTADAAVARDLTPRNGRVWVHFGPPDYQDSSATPVRSVAV